ncbi:hypothetical protein QBL07_017945 [Gordonia rubripertincta]|uniref:hypothetical protein n=1 Tax=Gordonia rubripertincta TaxID=36822 RepID=UPI0039B38DE6
MRNDPDTTRELNREHDREDRQRQAEQRQRIAALVAPRTRTDADWRAEVAALVNPTNRTQEIALHYATTLGVAPIKVYAHDGARIPETGTTGAVALPEPATMAAHIAAMDDTHQLGIRLPANIIGIDIDTYDVQNAGRLVHKRGGTTITNLESKLGQLPPTLSSSRRTPISDAPHHRTGIYFYRLRERTLTYYARRGHHFLQLRDIPPHVETIAFSYRYAAVAPTTADGLTYTWRAPDGTVIDPSTSPTSRPSPNSPTRGPSTSSSHRIPAAAPTSDHPANPQEAAPPTPSAPTPPTHGVPRTSLAGPPNPTPTSATSPSGSSPTSAPEHATKPPSEAPTPSSAPPSATNSGSAIQEAKPPSPGSQRRSSTPNPPRRPSATSTGSSPEPLTSSPPRSTTANSSPAGPSPSGTAPQQKRARNDRRPHRQRPHRRRRDSAVG